MARRFKRIIGLSDPHCGHWVGLTPPGWQWKPAVEEDDYSPDNPHARLRQKFLAVQQDVWGWYYRTVQSLKPIDRIMCLGDCIEGRGYRSGGTELLVTDRQEQVNMAVKCLRTADAEKYCIVRGTPYHSGEVEDWENDVAVGLRGAGYTVAIGNHEWPEVNGVVFDLKHAIGGSGTPARPTNTIANAHLWNSVWAEQGEQPRAQILLRGHVHYYQHEDRYIGDKWHHLAILPALQGMGSKYGAKLCQGHVQVGLVCIDIDEKGAITWQPHIARLDSQKAKAWKF